MVKPGEGGNMKKTNKNIYLYCKRMGWNFNRVIYTDGKTEYIKINGSYIDLDWCIIKADDMHIYSN